jgi:hypothetical protein
MLVPGAETGVIVELNTSDTQFRAKEGPFPFRLKKALSSADMAIDAFLHQSAQSCLVSPGCYFVGDHGCPP